MSILVNLPQPLTVHAWNSDRTEVAVSQNDNKVLILKKTGNSFSVVHTLGEHDKLVTGIDWGHKTNRIVTCSQDRNAYVWTYDRATNQWKPVLVLLRINRAATSVKWSPNEDKFAVASGARAIAICYYDEENNWWVSKHIKKPIRSTVLSLDWHPNNVLLTAGTSDTKARVFSAFIKGVDKKAGDPVWGDKLPLGTLCGEFGGENGGWVHGVAFSPSGNTVAWVGHDSTVGIASPGQNYITTIKVASLPLTCILFLNENQVVSAGYDAVPYLFQLSANGWQFVRKLDDGLKKSSGADSAMNKFKQMDTKGQVGDDSQLDSVHQNNITNIVKYEEVNGNVVKFTTSGQDGQIVLWDTLSLGIKQLSLR